MINKEILIECKKLYEKIFNESIDNSKEFLTFVQGNPHLLRIKIEEEIAKINQQLMMSSQYYSKEEISAAFGLSGVGEEVYKQFKLPDSKKLTERRSLLKDLEKIVMEYIENI